MRLIAHDIRPLSNSELLFVSVSCLVPAIPRPEPTRLRVTRAPAPTSARSGAAVSGALTHHIPRAAVRPRPHQCRRTAEPLPPPSRASCREQTYASGTLGVPRPPPRRSAVLAARAVFLRHGTFCFPVCPIQPAAAPRQESFVGRHLAN